MLSKRFLMAFGLVVLTGVTGVASAAGTRVAFINATKVVEESPQYAAAKKKLEREFSKRNSALVAKQKQLKKLEQKLERDAAVMSEAEVKRLERDILSRRRKLKNLKTEFREDFALRRNEEINKLRRKVAEVVKAVGRDEKIDLIVSDGVVYFSKRVDISDKVLARLKRSK